MTHPPGGAPEHIDCERAESLILEAELDELRGAGDGALTRHLGACESCRLKAGRIVAAEDRLSRALDERASAVGVEEMLARVRSEVTGGRAHSAPRKPVGASGRWRLPASLAAAAMVAALVLWATRSGPDGGSFDPPVAGPMTEPLGTDGRGALRVEADRRFALMKTDDPTISVVWFY